MEGKAMTKAEAAQILDPETSYEALQPYDYDERLELCEEACRIAAYVLRSQAESEV